MILFRTRHGFTLIELSVVLIIIGLVLGGILVGKDLIKAAEIRSLISQKQEYNTAANTFKEKYNYLPGDIPPSETAQLGFFTFTGSFAGKTGRGNGNGIIEVTPNIEQDCAGECGAFWRHLSDARLIAGNYGADSNKPLEDNTNLGLYYAGAPKGELQPFTHSVYMPQAKYGNTFLAAGSLYSSLYFKNMPNLNQYQNIYYLAPQWLPGSPELTPSLTASDAFSVDSKIDDGMPNTGKVMINAFDLTWYSARWWDTTAHTGICSYGGTNSYDSSAKYNISPASGADEKTCIPIFLFN
jgi:prepilin-type N-terminal cleavage/methylation domain-containing protein